MKLRILLIFLLCGLTILIGLAGFLIHLSSKQFPDINKMVNTKQHVLGQPPSFTDSVIEVGNEFEKSTSSKTGLRPKISQHSSTQASKEYQLKRKVEPVGKITHLSGIASVTDQAGKARLLAVDNGILRMDKIETALNAKLEIKFNDGTVISQGEKSVIVIEECIFDAAKPAECCFVLRFVRGICRIVTGLITDINPQRFIVKSRMSTTRIHGCDLVFKSTLSRNDIYVLDMGRAKSINVETTSDGSPVIDTITGRYLPVDENRKSHISITEPQAVVSVVNGKEPEYRNIGMDEARGLITETSNLIPARYELQQKANGAILKIISGKTPDNSTTTLQQK
jgi:hypothetical protein